MVAVRQKDEHISYVVRDAAGKALLQSSDADLAKFPQNPPLGFSSTERVRAYTESGVKGTIFVTTVEDLGHRRRAVWRSVAALIWPLVALAPTVVAVIWISIRLAFKPVERFRAELADRGRGNLAAGRGRRTALGDRARRGFGQRPDRPAERRARSRAQLRRQQRA